MIRHLHDKHIREDLTTTGGATYSTAYDYDQVVRSCWVCRVPGSALSV